MRVTLLGTGSADGWPNPFCTCASCAAERAARRARRPSSALVDDRVLIDCGPTTPHLAATGEASLIDVEHVLITHGHPDHLQPAFLLSWRWVSPARRLQVWGPPLAIDLCRDWIGPDSQVDLHVMTPGEPMTLTTAAGDYVVEALPARHAHGDGDAMAAEALLLDITGPSGARLLYATDTGPFVPAQIGLSRASADIVLLDETFGDHVDHGTGHLDLATLPGLVGALREHGTITDSTVVVATHLSHHNPPTDDLRVRLGAIGVRVGEDLEVIDTDTAAGPVMRTLILGGARSGKSTYAERLLASHERVTYVATGGTRPDDPEWAQRIDAHRARRPAQWTTAETTDLCAVLASASEGSALLVDCLALWLTDVLDRLDAWRRTDGGDVAGVLRDAHQAIDDTIRALRDCAADVVLVSNEAGMGVVPATSSGRLFRDVLGTLNARIADACDRTVLVVAGRPLVLEERHD